LPLAARALVQIPAVLASAPCWRATSWVTFL